MIKLLEKLDSLSDMTGRVISWATLFMVLITFTVVVLRYAFDLGWIAMQESVTYLHASVFMLGAAYTLRHQGHVRVDIFYQGFSAHTRALVDLFGTLLFLMPVCIFIFWVSWDYVNGSWKVLEGSREAGGIPAVFLLKGLILLLPVTLFLQGLSTVLRSVLILQGRLTGQQSHG